jgi:4'-phosphopantetheinyl transferase
MIELPDDEAHLWYTEEDKIQDPNLLSHYEALLTEEEKIKWRRFYFEADQHRYLITRALLKTTLSQYIHQHPNTWSFAENQYGRPHLAEPEHAWLRFNLSHTTGMVVCLVSRQREVGVDVENLERKIDSLLGIAERFFAPKEVSALQALPIAEQRQRFFSYWTLKESYIKARGMGLSLPLEKFAFVSLSPIVIELDPSLQDHAARWEFSLRSLGGQFLLATALENTGQALRVIEKKVVPLWLGG